MVGYEMLAQSQRDLTAEQVIDTKFTHRTVIVRCKIKWHNITKHLTVLLPDVFLGFQYMQPYLFIIFTVLQFQITCYVDTLIPLGQLMLQRAEVPCKRWRIQASQQTTLLMCCLCYDICKWLQTFPILVFSSKDDNLQACFLHLLCTGQQETLQNPCACSLALLLIIQTLI